MARLPRPNFLLRMLEGRRPVDTDDLADREDDPVGSAGPAGVLRDGLIFWSQCPVCPWEGDSRFLHIDAAIDSAQHNTAIHPASPLESSRLTTP